MKCPKCGYISFDYNRNCPKCKKSLTEQAVKMNLPEYEPAPPLLLGSLIGELSKESRIMEMDHLPDENVEGGEMIMGSGYEDGDAASFDSDQDMEIDFDDTQPETAAETRFNLPGLAEAVAEIDSDSAETDEFSIDLEDFSIDGSSKDYGQESQKPNEIDFQFEPSAPNEIQTNAESLEVESESGFEFLDLSAGEDEAPQDDFREPEINEETGLIPDEPDIEFPDISLDEKFAASTPGDLEAEGAQTESPALIDELSQEEPDEGTGPLLYPDEETEAGYRAEVSGHEEIEFDPENYRIPLDEDLDNAGKAALQSMEDEGIPFDSGAMDIKLDQKEEEDSPETSLLEDIDLGDISKLELEENADDLIDSGAGEDRSEEDLTIVMDDFDFEVLEDEDGEEKK